MNPAVESKSYGWIFAHDRSRYFHQQELSLHATGLPDPGKLVLCIQNHLDHQRHIPECIQHILRPTVAYLAGQMELKTEDSRPNKEFWKMLDKEDFIRKSLQRHLAKERESDEPSGGD